MTKAFALGKRWYGGIRGNRRLLDLGISSARSELMLSQKFQAGRNPYSVFGISLRAYATKYATSSAQPNQRLQPAPPWPYEWMMRLGLVVDLPHRLICLLGSSSTRTFRFRKGRNPCARGYSGSRRACRSPGRNCSHRWRLPFTTGESKVRSSAYSFGSATPPRRRMSSFRGTMNTIGLRDYQ